MKNLWKKIEVLKEEISKIISISQEIIDKFKEIGFSYITIDLEGFRTGSMNEVLKDIKVGDILG